MEIVQPAGGGSGPGGSLTVTDGVTPVVNVTTIDFTSNATVTDAGGGVAEVAIAGGSGSPGGSNTQLQYNNASSFGGITGVTSNGTAVTFASTALIASNIVNSGTLTLPTSSDTLVGRATTDTLTNKTFNTAGTGNVFQINGTGITAVTGTGAVVLATSPTLVTPVLGAATATSINGLTITSSTGTVTITNGKTLAVTNTLTLSGTDSTVMTFPSTTQTIAGLTSTQTLTNKRVTKRLVTVNAPGATPSTNTDNVDIAEFTGLAAAITSMTTNLTGTPVNGDMVEFMFLDDGTARAITWGSSFANGGLVNLPTTTVISTMLRVLVQYQTTASLNKWVCISIA